LFRAPLAPPAQPYVTLALRGFMRVLTADFLCPGPVDPEGQDTSISTPIAFAKNTYSLAHPSCVRLGGEPNTACTLSQVTADLDDGDTTSLAKARLAVHSRRHARDARSPGAAAMEHRAISPPLLRAVAHTCLPLEIS